MILGQILTAGEGQNPARQASIGAGLPKETTAWGLNQLCGSGLRTVAVGMQQILTGDAKVIVAGGQESMSMAPHCAHLRNGVKMGDFSMVDTMIKDGLWDAFNGYHMGNTAENVAREFQITRDDAGPVRRRLAEQGRGGAEGRPLQGRDRPLHGQDPQGRHRRRQATSTPRAGTTIEALTKLRPAFAKDGTVTAGNASGINDGAAAVVLMSAAEAARRGVTPLARIVSWATAGVDPAVMGTGPIPSSRKALEKAGWTVDDLDLIEANEAFAAQACAVNKDLGWNPRDRQRQWRGDRPRPPDRRLGRARAGDAALRDAEARRQARPRHALHRRRHGHRHVRRALSRQRDRTARRRGPKRHRGKRRLQGEDWHGRRWRSSREERAASAPRSRSG